MIRIKTAYWLYCVQNKWLRFVTPEHLKNCQLAVECGQRFINKWCEENPPTEANKNYFQLDLPSTHWSHSAQKLIFELEYEN